MRLWLKKFTKFAQFLVVDRANCNYALLSSVQITSNHTKANCQNGRVPWVKKADLVRVRPIEIVAHSTSAAGAIGCWVIRRVMQWRVWSVPRGTGMNAIVIKQRRRDRNQRFARASICNHLHCRWIILITFVVTTAVLRVSAPAHKQVNCQRLTGT